MAFGDEIGAVGGHQSVDEILRRPPVALQRQEITGDHLFRIFG